MRDPVLSKMSVRRAGGVPGRGFPEAFSHGASGRKSRRRDLPDAPRYNDGTLRPGGTVSGPTLMAMADFAMYVVLLSAIGPVGLAATTNLNINFLRKGKPGQDVLAAAGC